MTVTKVGINGFGDIGKLIPRLLIEIMTPGIEVVRINTSSSTLASHVRRFNVDSNYQFHMIPKQFRPRAFEEDGKLVIEHPNKKRFVIECSNMRHPEDIDWSDCDIVIDSTGKFKTRDELKGHQVNNNSVSHIILTCPPKDSSIPLFTFGVNDKDFNFDEHNIISNGSCSGNCAAPILNYIHTIYGLKIGIITGIHCNTNSEYINDSYHPKEENRGRASFMNTKAITTGIMKSIYGLMPEMKNIINPNVDNFRVSTDGSLVNFALEIKKDVTREVFIKNLKEHEYFPHIIGLEHEKMTSKDIIGYQTSSIISVSEVSIWNNWLRLTAYYDNRMGYSKRICELIEKIHSFKEKQALKPMIGKILSNS